MNGPVLKKGCVTTFPVPAIDVFRERCEARAILVEACLFDLQDAVDGLQQAAVGTELVAEIGQDAVQAMMAEAFGRLSRRLDNFPAGGKTFQLSSHDDNCPDVGTKSQLSRWRDNCHDVVTIPKPRGAAKSTLQAADYLVKLKDPARLKAWLVKHTRVERDAIIKHIRRTR